MQGQLPAASERFGRTGMGWLRNAPLEFVYRQRIDPFLESIDAYDGQIEVFPTMIANRFAGHRGYQVIQQISGAAPEFRRGVPRRDRRYRPVLPSGEAVLLGRTDPASPR